MIPRKRLSGMMGKEGKICCVRKLKIEQKDISERKIKIYRKKCIAYIQLRLY